MKYTVEIEINLPVDRVIELFDNPNNLKLWMDGLQSFEHISGDPGQPGAKSRLKFKMGKREIEMIETVFTRNLPSDFSGAYDTPHMYNIVKNSFIPTGENKTRYVSEQEYQMKNFMMKAMGFLMPGAFKKQSMKYLNAFKDFAESQG